MGDGRERRLLGAQRADLRSAPWLLSPVLGLWGLAVTADSATRSDATDARYVGTALNAQYAIGFLITIATIRLLPTVADAIGWRWALTVLTLGPISGVLAMCGLRRAGVPSSVVVLEST